MTRGGIRGAALPAIVLVAALIGDPASAGQPFGLDPATLDLVTAGGAKRAKTAGIGLQVVAPGPDRALAELALKLAGQQPPVVTPPSGGSGSTGGGKKSITLSGKKTFKSERVTKPHMETLVVSGSIRG